MITTALGDADCTMCGHARSVEVSSDRNRREGLEVIGEYRQCARCGHIFLWPAPTPQALKEYYESATFENEARLDLSSKPRFPGLNRTLGFAEHRLLGGRTAEYFAGHRYLPELEGRSGRLLDMGCGEGSTLQAFRNRGWEICGVDISPEAIAEARKKLPEATLEVTNLEATEVRLGQFDLVRLDNVLEHVLDPEKVLRAALGYLRPGGRLAVYVPHGRSLSLRLWRSRSVSHWVPFHLNLFTARSLSELMVRAGFGEVEIRYLDPPSWWTLTMAQVVDPDVRLNEVGSQVTQAPSLRALSLPFRLLSPVCRGEELFALARKL